MSGQKSQKKFLQARKDGIMTSKTFWRAVKHFLTNEICASNGLISIEDHGDLISNEEELLEIPGAPEKT